MTHPHHRRRLAARVCTQDGFSAGGHSGLSLLNRGEQAFTENQAFPLPHAAVEGISELAHLNGELAQVITELLHGTFLARRNA
jgi:hypothetical protein